MSDGDLMQALSLAWQGFVLIFQTPKLILPLAGVGVFIGVCSGLYYRRKFRREQT